MLFHRGAYPAKRLRGIFASCRNEAICFNGTRWKRSGAYAARSHIAHGHHSSTVIDKVILIFTEIIIRQLTHPVRQIKRLFTKLFKTPRRNTQQNGIFHHFQIISCGFHGHHSTVTYSRRVIPTRSSTNHKVTSSTISSAYPRTLAHNERSQSFFDKPDIRITISFIHRKTAFRSKHFLHPFRQFEYRFIRQRIEKTLLRDEFIHIFHVITFSIKYKDIQFSVPLI